MPTKRCKPEQIVNLFRKIETEIANGETLQLARFESAVVTGEYPFASIEFNSLTFPAGAQLGAFNPLTSLDPDASSLSVAVPCDIEPTIPRRAKQRLPSRSVRRIR